MKREDEEAIPVEAKRELNNPYGSKLDSANLLILGMEGLRPGRVVPVSQAAVEDAGAVSDAVDQQRPWSSAHVCRPLCNRCRTRCEAHMGATAGQNCQIPSRCALPVPTVGAENSARRISPLRQVLPRVQEGHTNRQTAARFRDRSGRHGKSRGGLAVEPTRHEGPQVRNDPKWPKRAHWHILEFQASLGFA